MDIEQVHVDLEDRWNQFLDGLITETEYLNNCAAIIVKALTSREAKNVPGKTPPVAG